MTTSGGPVSMMAFSRAVLRAMWSVTSAEYVWTEADEGWEVMKEAFLERLSVERANRAM